MAVTAEIIVASVAMMTAWSAVGLDYYDVIDRMSFRRLSRRIYSVSKKGAVFRAFPTTGPEMACDGNGRVIRDNHANSGAGSVTRVQCPGCILCRDRAAEPTGSITIVRRATPGPS